MGQPSAEQMEVDQEGGVANLLEARNRPQQPKLPASTSSQDTLGSPMNRQRDAELPETRYFVEEEVLAGPEVLVLETINEEIVSIFDFHPSVLFLGSYPPSLQRLPLRNMLEFHLLVIADVSVYMGKRGGTL